MTLDILGIFWISGFYFFASIFLTLPTGGVSGWRRLWGELRYGDTWVPGKDWWAEVGLIVALSAMWPLILGFLMFVAALVLILEGASR